MIAMIWLSKNALGFGLLLVSMLIELYSCSCVPLTLVCVGCFALCAISILPTISKIFEKRINKYLMLFFFK